MTRSASSRRFPGHPPGLARVAFLVSVLVPIPGAPETPPGDGLAIRHPLTADDIESAVAIGNDVEADIPSLSLGSSGVNWGGPASDSNRTGHFFEQNMNRRQRTSGFGVELFTPYAWVARITRDSLAKGRPIEVRHVEADEQLLEPLLHVLCHADVPEAFVEGVYGNPVVEVSIRPTSKNVAQAATPIQEIRIPRRVQTPDGDSVDVGPLLAGFALDDVLAVSSLDKKGEFYVVIVAANGDEKDFKVKSKHFDSLP